MFNKRVKISQPEPDPFIKRVNRVNLFIRFYQNEKKNYEKTKK